MTAAERSARHHQRNLDRIKQLETALRDALYALDEAASLLGKKKPQSIEGPRSRIRVLLGK